MKKISELVYCERKKKSVPLEKCLNDYVNNTAFNNTKNDCCHCSRGTLRREKFSRIAPLDYINTEPEQEIVRKKFRRNS